MELEELMRLSAKKIFRVAFLFAILLLSPHVSIYGQSEVDQSIDTDPKSSIEVPALAEIIPAAAELSSRLGTAPRS
jgi:hypothetical protein